jgi:hypothetical protein
MLAKTFSGVRFMYTPPCMPCLCNKHAKGRPKQVLANGNLANHLPIKVTRTFPEFV